MENNNEIIHIKKINNSFGYIDTSDYDLLSTIDAYMSYYVQGYTFMPSYQNGFFDGKIHLFDVGRRVFPLGLVENLLEIFKKEKRNFELDTSIFNSFIDMKYDEEKLRNFFKSINLFIDRKKIEPRDDQLEAVLRAIKLKRCINECPTSFGKSLSITLECLYHIKNVRRCLIVVPTKDLVKQFNNDIINYATNEKGYYENWLPKIQMIFSGKSKNLDDDTEICISTWQSLMSIYKDNKEIMNKFDVVIMDECHKASAKSLKKLMDSAGDVEYRTGWTGTLSNEELAELLVLSLFGKNKKITTTKELMDKAIVAELNIIILSLRYPKHLCKDVLSLDYAHQTAYIEYCNSRTKKILEYVGLIKNNGLLFYKKIAHGEKIRDTVKEMYPDKNIYFIHSSHYELNGEMYKSFEDLKPLLEKDTNGILIANYQLASTGISVRNISYICFFVPIKSYIQTLQSIGRGLRISDTKKKVTLIDVVDDFSLAKGKSVYKNYALKHSTERIAIYNEAEFNYNCFYIDLEPEKEDLDVYSKIITIDEF